jgi:hypothetical protein
VTLLSKSNKAANLPVLGNLGKKKKKLVKMTFLSFIHSWIGSYVFITQHRSPASYELDCVQCMEEANINKPRLLLWYGSFLQTVHYRAHALIRNT